MNNQQIFIFVSICVWVSVAILALEVGVIIDDLRELEVVVASECGS